MSQERISADFFVHRGGKGDCKWSASWDFAEVFLSSAAKPMPCFQPGVG